MQEEYVSPVASKLTFWCQTTGLKDRASLSHNISSVELEVNQKERAKQRIKHWKEIFGDDEELYKEWLEYSNISETDLFHLLGETPSELCKSTHSPSWFHTFSTAFELYAEPDNELLKFLLILDETDTNTAQQISEEPKQENTNIHVLLTIVEPLIRLGHQCLLNCIRTIEQQHSFPIVEVENLVFFLLSTLALRIQDILSRTLMLEFRIAQRQGIISEKSTLRERLQIYARHIRRRDIALEFFSEYPVLSRKVTICVEQWCESNVEMLTRLSQDWSNLHTLFCSDGELGTLQQVDSNLGDGHRGGRSVQMLTFSSGLRLVYKPRSLAVDEHFQELIQWLNDHGQEPTLRSLKVLNRITYGWVEYVEAYNCTSLDEIKNFYMRQGANLALLYALEATDFHYENIIASGEYPMLVDLESLMHVHTEVSFTKFGKVEQLAYKNVSSSVLRTLLLPYRPLADENQAWAEISGLGGTPGQPLPAPILKLSGFDTGELYFSREQGVLQGAKNRPHLNGEEIDIFTYLPQISEGFARTYRLLLFYRQELLGEHGMLARFATDTTRVILRPTLHYWQILQTCLHPYLLHDELDQERIKNVLWRVIKDQPHMKKVIDSEQKALLQGDIPLFTTQVASSDLWTSSGEQISNFFDLSALESIQQHWQKFCEQDLESQLWFIHASFTTLMPVEEAQQTFQIDGMLPSMPEQHLSHVGVGSREELLLAALAIGDRICHLATLEGESATWLGLTQMSEQWMLVLADVNIYSGLTGIILALAYLGALTHSEKYTSMAKQGLATVRERIAYDRHDLKNIGFFAGWGGVIAALAHLAVLWRDEELLQEAHTIVEILPPLIDQDDGLDLFRGSAGCIAGLLCLDNIAPSKHIEAILLQCGQHLAATATSLSSGIGWRVFKDTPCLTGFAHGSAGFTWALLSLSRRIGDTRFYKLALDSLAYERSLYNPDFKNWRDMRRSDAGTEATYRLAWCYGAPGIGLARLDTLDILDDSLIRTEIQAALETTLAEGFGSNHSLCHGDLGNLETIYRAQQILPDKRLQATYSLLKSSLLESGRQSGWFCGTPKQVETPGLMIGLAGICMQLLRLAEPERVPSILTMDTPPLVKQ